MCTHALAVAPRGIDPRHQAVDLCEQALGGHRPPVGRTHVLDDGVDHLAAALLHNQALITLLLGADVADAKVQHVPHHGQVGHIAVTVLRGRRFQRLGPGAHALAAGGVGVITAHVAGVQGHARQHVETGQVKLALGKRLFHDFQPAFEVVLHRTSHGLMQGQRAAKRFLVLVHADQIALGALLAGATFDRLAGHCTSAHDQRQQADAE
ncbi:hypothetical protein D3C85_969720 [compost metagenome]